MDSRTYPQGSGTLKSKYITTSAGLPSALVFYHPTTGAEAYRFDPSVQGCIVALGMVRSFRARFAIAAVNAGATVLAALANYKYRMTSCHAIAIGGAAAAVTTVDILGTQSAGSVKLVAFAQASLTRSTILTSGGSGAAVLADGASYVTNDVNTAITIGVTGSAITTATHIDVNINYVIEL